jgi:hypothetical protein
VGREKSTGPKKRKKKYLSLFPHHRLLTWTDNVSYVEQTLVAALAFYLPDML